MPSLERVLQRGLKRVTNETSIVDAAKKMREDRIGALLVQKNSDFIGLVTETDLVRKAVADAKDLGKTSVEQVMTAPINTIEMSRSLQDAHDMMADLGVRHLVVCQAGTIVGIVSVRDLLSSFKRVSEPKIAQD